MQLICIYLHIAWFLHICILFDPWKSCNNWNQIRMWSFFPLWRRVSVKAEFHGSSLHTKFSQWKWCWLQIDDCMTMIKFHVSLLITHWALNVCRRVSSILNLWWSHCELHGEHLFSAAAQWSQMCESADKKFIWHLSGWRKRGKMQRKAYYRI